MNSNTVKNVGAAITAAAAVPTKKVLSAGQILKYFLYFIVIGAIVGLIIYGIFSLIDTINKGNSTRSTPENNAVIKLKQIKRFEPIYMQRDKIPAYQMATAGIKSANIPPLSEDQLALINYDIMTANYAGYVGPNINGVFAEDDAIRIAMRAGCRAFVLHIDYVDNQPDIPVLIVRNAGGDKVSNNTGNIRRVSQAISSYMPRGSASDPIIVILFFHRLPDKNPYSAVSLKFMSLVAEGLEPLKDKHLGMTADGDYRRQAQADMLFLRNRSEYDGKVIVLCNVDTSGFRNQKVLPSVKPSQDLDLWTHIRIYRDTSERLGLTTAPEDIKAVASLVETPEYFTNLPDDRVAKQVANSKVRWTIAMHNSLGPTPSAKTMKTLLDERGISSLPINVFDDDAATLSKTVLSNEFFGTSGYRPKVVAMRYNKPKPVKLTMPNKQLDARGGIIPTPTTGLLG